MSSSACYHCLVGANFDFPFIQHSIHGFQFAEIEASLGFPVSLICTFTVPILSFGLGFTAGQSSYAYCSVLWHVHSIQMDFASPNSKDIWFSSIHRMLIHHPNAFLRVFGVFQRCEQLLSFSSTTIFRSPSTSENILRDALAPFDFCCVMG